MAEFKARWQASKSAPLLGENYPLRPACRTARNVAMRVSAKIAVLVAAASLILTPAKAGPFEDGKSAYIKGDYATAL